EEGFPVGLRLHTLLMRERALKQDPVAAAYFYDADGQPHAVGTLLRNPALASTLRMVAEQGAQAFYKGDIARAIVAKVRGHATNPGVMSEQDLAGYQSKEREPLCNDYK